MRTKWGTVVGNWGIAKTNLKQIPLFYGLAFTHGFQCFIQKIRTFDTVLRTYFHLRRNPEMDLYYFPYTSRFNHQAQSSVKCPAHHHDCTWRRNKNASKYPKRCIRIIIQDNASDRSAYSEVRLIPLSFFGIDLPVRRRNHTYEHGKRVDSKHLAKSRPNLGPMMDRKIHNNSSGQRHKWTWEKPIESHENNDAGGVFDSDGTQT